MNLMRMSNSIQIASPLKPLPLKEHRQQQEETPSSSSLSQHRIVSPKKIEDHQQPGLKEERVLDACDDDGDDGYHTPTSPRHRIPKATVCPLAPKRPSLPQRCKKRKARFDIEIKDVQLYFVAEADEEKRSKKAREEVVSNYFNIN
ncbi:uncharacterized protein A4U43_C08F34840 [Asparagus officinalis]|uniref:cyclin-dependent protein kinase inhibitor SMR2-like n=1 Tax=Asparagus officinalis TaxID=4686 RepID=UPI00098DE3AE|nr:cyclin-dependent protein kinase inhibitor SMR2-like [Asparagus officinalis]ONK61911.1 uncharacterized protein A4U43_C08F34840 [Asparagus officinalis]